MSRLYLVRHGRTAHNLARRIQGTLIDDPLDEVGRAQAAALAERFRQLAAEGERFGGVYASPMRRAVETAAPVAAALGLAVTPLPAVVEFSWGELMGKVEEGDIAALTRATLARWTAGEVELAAPGGESPRAALERTTAALATLAARHPADSFVLVAHGRINKIILADLLHRDVSRMEDFPQSNTGVTLLEGPAPWRVAYVNDRRHLDAGRGSGSGSGTTGGAPASAATAAPDAASSARRRRGWSGAEADEDAGERSA